MLNMSIDFSDVAASPISPWIDIVIIVGAKEYHFTRVLLAIHSKYFSGLFAHNIGVTRTELTECDAFNDVLNFIWCAVNGAPFAINAENLNDILRAADLLIVPALLRLCDEFILKNWSDYWDAKSINTVFLASLVDMREKVISRIYDEPSSVSLLRDAAELDVCVIRTLIERFDGDYVPNEVVRLILLWVEFHTAQNLKNIINCRFVAHMHDPCKFIKQLLTLQLQECDRVRLYAMAGHIYLYGRNAPDVKFVA
jgi:hypothetical protein